MMTKKNEVAVTVLRSQAKRWLKALDEEGSWGDSVLLAGAFMLAEVRKQLEHEATPKETE